MYIQYTFYDGVKKSFSTSAYQLCIGKTKPHNKCLYKRIFLT